MIEIARRGVCLVLSAPSGAGKTAIADALLATEPELERSISVTTRARRPAEIDGVHYHFLTEERFQDALRDDALLEWARVLQGTHAYGTPRAPVEKSAGRGPRRGVRHRLAGPSSVAGETAGRCGQRVRPAAEPGRLARPAGRPRRRPRGRNRASDARGARRDPPLGGVRPRGGERRPSPRHRNGPRGACTAQGLPPAGCSGCAASSRDCRVQARPGSESPQAERAAVMNQPRRKGRPRKPVPSAGTAPPPSVIARSAPAGGRPTRDETVIARNVATWRSPAHFAPWHSALRP